MSVIGVLPHTWLGGTAADYAVRVGSSGTMNTIHLATGRSIQSVLPNPASVLDPAMALQPLMGAVMPALQVANLGVGLANLGVSAYNAYQLHQVRRGQERLEEGLGQVQLGLQSLGGQLEASTRRLETILHQQSVALGILLDGQRVIADRLELLRAEIAEGFSDMHQHLVAAEATGRREEFETRMRTLFVHHRALCAEVVAADRQPTSGALRSVINTAADVIGWLETQVAKLDVGAPARLPLFVAMVTATRMLVDARSLEHPDASPPREEYDDLAARIALEAETIFSGCSMYGLGVEWVEILQQYVFLRRGLLHEPDIAIDDRSGKVVALLPPPVLDWSDLLDDVREAVLVTPERVDRDDPLEVETLADKEWLMDWLGDTPATFEDDEETYTVGDLLDSVGAPDSVGGVAAAAVTGLRNAAVPMHQRKVRSLFELEFGSARRGAS